MTEKHDGFAKFNKRIQQVRVQYLGAGNTGLPYYFVFDPKKLDTPLSSLAGLGSKREFLDFFQSAQQKVSKAGGD